MDSIKKSFLIFIPKFPSSPTKQWLQIEIDNAIITTLAVIYHLLFNSVKYLEFRSRSNFYKNNKWNCISNLQILIKHFLARGHQQTPLLARANYSTIAK